MKKTNIKYLLLIPFIVGCSPQHYDVTDYRLTMDFHEDFKILQLTDLHLGIESNVQAQFDFIKKSINEANPDLIILTGDNFMYSSKQLVDNTFSFFNECCKELTNKNNKPTKFAVTYGNHDNQGDYPRYYMNESISRFANEDNYALFVDYEDDDIFGLTNYYIDLVSPTDKNDVVYRLHIIDSNTYQSQGIKYGYDVIREDQLHHAKNIYNDTPTNKDYLGLAFFHIPLLNYKEAINQYYDAEDKSKVGQGSFLDKEHYPYKDNGSYNALKEANIIGYFAGHDHKNYGDILYKDSDGDTSLLSYGVKSTNQLYHDKDIMGYKTINLKDVDKNTFLSMEYISQNIINVIDKGGNYDK